MFLSRKLLALDATPPKLVGKSSNGTSGALTTTLPVGLLPGDLVIVATGFLNSDSDAGVSSPTDYVELVELFSNDSRPSNFSVSYKFMGNPVDASVTVKKTGSYGLGTAVYAFRGVDPITPFDVPFVSAVGANTGIFKNPAITPITPNSVVVIAGGFASGDIETGLIPPTGFGDVVIGTHDPHLSFTSMMAYRDVLMPETITPGFWSGHINAASDYNSWCAVTLALRHK